MVEAMRLADYRLVALFYTITLFWLMVRGVVWRTLLKNQATYSQVFFTLNEGYLLNNLLPFRLGEVARALLLSGKTQLGFWQVLPTIIIERILDLAMAVGLLVCTLPFVIGAEWAMQAAVAAGSIVLVGLGSLFLLARNREWALRQFDKLAGRWHWLDRLVSKQAPSFFAGLEILTDARRFITALLLMLLNWGVAIVQYYTLVLAFFPQGKILWAAFGLGVVALGIAAPSSPGAVGVLELAMVGALKLFDLDSSTALALALTAHLGNYVVTGLLGAFALTQEGETLTGLYRRVRRASAQPEE